MTQNNIKKASDLQEIKAAEKSRRVCTIELTNHKSDNCIVKPNCATYVTGTFDELRLLKEVILDTRNDDGIADITNLGRIGYIPSKKGHDANPFSASSNSDSYNKNILFYNQFLVEERGTVLERTNTLIDYVNLRVHTSLMHGDVDFILIEVSSKFCSLNKDDLQMLCLCFNYIANERDFPILILFEIPSHQFSLKSKVDEQMFRSEMGTYKYLEFNKNQILVDSFNGKAICKVEEVNSKLELNYLISL